MDGHENCPMETLSLKLVVDGVLAEFNQDELAAITASKHLFCAMMRTSPRTTLDALGSLAAEFPPLFDVYANMVRMMHEGKIPCANKKETDQKLN